MRPRNVLGCEMPKLPVWDPPLVEKDEDESKGDSERE